MLRVLALAVAAAGIAACGGRDEDKELSTNVEPAPENKPAPREAAAGEWYYKESNGYPWAGFGPPRSEAVFVIACQQGQIFFQYADRNGGPASIQLAEGKQAIEMTPNDAGLPMSEGSLPANNPFVHLIAESQKPMRVVAHDRTMVLPADVSYKRVINTCIEGA